MIDFSDKIYSKILEEQLSKISNEIDKREGSLIQTALGPESYALEDVYMDLTKLQDNGFAKTAVGQPLDYKVAEAGLIRYSATAAVRQGEFNIDVPIGSRFSTNSGASSVVFRAAEKTSTGKYRMICEVPGEAGNTYTGDLISITFVADLTSARLTDILVPGDDEETDEALRTRYFEYVSSKPFGGNVADYRSYITGMDGVGGVQVYPTWNGGGTVECSIIGADHLQATNTVIQQVQASIDPIPNSGSGYGLAPIGAKVTIKTPQTVNINVSATVSVAAGYTLSQLKAAMIQAVADYLVIVRQEWATPTVPGTTQYSTIIYRARIMAALLSITGVVNVTALKINGQDADTVLTETGIIQQLPILGTVTLNGN